MATSLEDSLARLLDQPVAYDPKAAAGMLPKPDSVALGPVAASDPIVPAITTTPAAATPAAATPAAATTAAAAPAAAAPAAAAPLGPDYKSYNEYYADNPEALKKAGYGYWSTPGEPLDTTSGVGSDWVNGNPYQYRNEYNEYLGTLPYEYQLLGQNNITGEAVKAGAVTGIYDKASGQTYSVGPDVAPGTVKSGAVATPTAASTLTKPVNPGPRAPWQQSQQYWKDLDAYTRSGGK